MPSETVSAIIAKAFSSCQVKYNMVEFGTSCCRILKKNNNNKTLTGLGVEPETPGLP